MTRPAPLLRAIQTYLEQYVAFSSPDHSFLCALWVVGTYLWPHFDAFPYLVITSDTKRSGKTRLSELLSFMVSEPRTVTGVTAATIYRMIRDDNPTLIIDEAESLSSDKADNTRAALNSGYRRGQTIPRQGLSGNIEHWPTYCAKIFILIGDVYDTLRDRSIVVRMVRAGAPQRFVYERAKAEGVAIRERMVSTVEDKRAALRARYNRHPGLPFLSDRDEEIWTPLAVINDTFADERVEEFQRMAVDMATEKTVAARVHYTLKDAEDAAESAEYAERLVRDLITVTNGHTFVYSEDAIERLRAAPTMPWRKFRGEGIDAIAVGHLLARYPGLKAKLIRTPGGKAKRGWYKEDLRKVVATL